MRQHNLRRAIRLTRITKTSGSPARFLISFGNLVGYKRRHNTPRHSQTVKCGVIATGTSKPQSWRWVASKSFRRHRDFIKQRWWNKDVATCLCLQAQDFFKKRKIINLSGSGHVSTNFSIWHFLGVAGGIMKCHWKSSNAGLLNLNGGPASAPVILFFLLVTRHEFNTTHNVFFANKWINGDVCVSRLVSIIISPLSFSTIGTHCKRIVPLHLNSLQQ